MESEDKKAKADKIIEHCMAHGDSLSEAALHADSYLRARRVDTRKQLEAEVMATVSNLVKYCGAHPALFEKAKSWLDRQEEITRRETRQSWQDAPNVLDRANLQTIAGLTAERDDLAHELRRARKAAKRWHELASGYRDKTAQLVETIETLTATVESKNAHIKRLRKKLKAARNK